MCNKKAFKSGSPQSLNIYLFSRLINQKRQKLSAKLKALKCIILTGIMLITAQKQYKFFQKQIYVSKQKIYILCTCLYLQVLKTLLT